MTASPGQALQLLLTDSLDRPLAGAAFSLHVGERAGEDNVHLEGQLDEGGRLSAPWHPAGLTLRMCYRSLVLVRGPESGLRHTRNRLACLGFCSGQPEDPPDPAEVQRALAALGDCARSAGESCEGDLLDLMERWNQGQIGLGPPAKPAQPRRQRRLEQLRRRFSGVRPEELEEGVPSGTHLCGCPPHVSHVVRLGVTVGPAGSAAARNRIVIFDWFSGHGVPPCAGNDLEILIDGEQAWAATAADIAAATEELCVTTWSVEPDIELVRPLADAHCNPEERRSRRFASLVEELAARGGRTTILVWSWIGTPILNPTLRKWALEAGDNVEVLQRGHPQLIGSFHQKTMVMDRRVAYCGGFNLRENDWDSQAHRIDDPRRNPHRLSGWERRSPLPRFPPRHDVAVRIRGPLVEDVHDSFVRYWNATRQIERRGLRHLTGRVVAQINGIGPADLISPIKQKSLKEGRIIAQLVRTDPRRRPHQQAVFDVLLRAIHNARRLIYIENQFFRSRGICKALVRALRKRPELGLIVVTNRIAGPWRFAYGGAYYTYRAQQAIRELRPEFCLHELLSCGTVAGALHYQPIEVHAKVMVVDDEWATVGSANLNERSILFESEANIAVEDQLFAQELRCRLMAEHLGLEPADPRLLDLSTAAELFVELARANAAARRQHRPAQGHAHPFEQQPSWSLLRGRGHWF